MNRRIFSAATLPALLASAMLALAGCEADPAKDSGFLEKPDMMQHYDLVPVQRMWRDPNMKAAHYNKIIVKPVFSKDQEQDKTWLEKNNMRTWLDEQDKDVADFAKYTEEAFKKAIREDKKFKLATEPGPDTMILELALVKIVPGKPVMGALGNVSNLTPIGFMLMPLKVGAKASSDSGMQASVAIEGRILDSQTKKVIAMFADRRKENAAVFNCNDFTAYGNLRQIVDEWARQFVVILNKRPLETGEKVEKGSSFKVINY